MRCDAGATRRKTKRSQVWPQVRPQSSLVAQGRSAAQQQITIGEDHTLMQVRHWLGEGMRGLLFVSGSACIDGIHRRFIVRGSWAKERSGTARSYLSCFWGRTLGPGRVVSRLVWCGLVWSVRSRLLGGPYHSSIINVS